MKRRVFVGTAFAGTSLTGAYAQAPKVKSGSIPTREFGKTGVKVSIIAQGGARMDLHPTVAEAADHVRRVYDLGLTYFDCARSYWGGKSEEAYGIGLKGVRKNVFLTSKTTKRTRQEAEQELATSLKTLQTDHLDVWQMHDVRTPEEIKTILGPGGAMEAFQAAKKAGKCRFIGFTGHFYPETHAALLQAYDHWDSVLLPIHAADHAYLSFEKTALPVAVSQGIGVQAIKVFCKAFLLRALSPRECLEYTLSMPVHVAVCGAGTQGQMEDNIRVAQSFKPLSAEVLADVRKRAIVGQGVYTGPTMEYWKKPA
jgi:predicted aldo/keto reductase-like oxidoreductase